MSNEHPARLEVSVYLADTEPVKSLVNIVGRMVSDDRIPTEYRFEIMKAVSPWLNGGKTVDIQ